VFAVTVKRSVHPDGMSRNLGRCPSILTIVEKSGRKCPSRSTIVEKLGRCAHLVRRIVDESGQMANVIGMRPEVGRSDHLNSGTAQEIGAVHINRGHCTRNRCTSPIRSALCREKPAASRNLGIPPSAEAKRKGAGASFERWRWKSFQGIFRPLRKSMNALFCASTAESRRSF